MSHHQVGVHLCPDSWIDWPRRPSAGITRFPGKRLLASDPGLLARFARPWHSILPGRDFRGARILMYHRVVDDEMPEGLRTLLSGAITRSAFCRQLDYVEKHFTIVSLESLLNANGPVDNIAAITFDDGYADNYRNAMPVLNSKNMPATIFMVAGVLESGKQAWRDRLVRKLFNHGATPLILETPDGDKCFDFRGNLRDQLKTVETWLGRQDVSLQESVVENQPDHPEDRFLNLAELMELERKGIKIQSHTMTHPHLTELDDLAIMRELRLSRALLETELNSPVSHIAYPYGDFDPRVKDIAMNVGYTAGFTACKGLFNRQSDPYEIPRIGSRESFNRFKRRMTSRYSA